MKFSTYYLGCRVNQAEIESFEDKLVKLGFELSKNGDANIIIFNTCSVTNKAERESYRLIRRVFSSNPNSTLFITGCIVPLNKSLINQVKEKIVGDNILLYDNIYVIPSTQKDQIIEIIKQKYPVNNVNNGKLTRFKYYVKVQDGCNHFCTFCIIPYTRGRSRSKRIEEVVQEIKQISQNIVSTPEIGCEITLTGICLGEYGLDINTSLAKLLKTITLYIPDNARLRLSSMDIITLDEELIETIANNNKICKHLHLSLQSGSNKILSLMKRNYTFEEYLNIIEKLRNNILDLGLTTDIIVGFPGEDDKDFEQTVQAVKEAKFHRIHIFPFSFRPYTYAYNHYRNIKIDHQRVKEYEKILASLSLRQSKEFINSRINKCYDILTEENGYGYTHNFIRVKTNITGTPKYHKLLIKGIEEEKGNFAVAKAEA
ncbi:MAG: MiaB/RimO family radical SAM methylthiotransferase [bacterium]